MEGWGNDGEGGKWRGKRGEDRKVGGRGEPAIPIPTQFMKKA